MQDLVVDRLLPSDVKRHLDTRWLGHDLRCFDAVDSTNNVARDAGRAGAAEGTVVIADGQSKGRGRLDRSWVSPPGLNLYLSAILRPRMIAEHVPLLSLAVGIAVCEAVREWDSRAMIKWPNDVVIDRAKTAGILMEAEGEGASLVVIAGIGVNLNARERDFPPDLRMKPGSLFMATGARIDRARFTARLLDHLERQYDELRHRGPEPILSAWWARSCHAQRRISVQAQEDLISGRAVGLDEDGALRIELECGRAQRVVAGDVTVVEWN